MLYVVTNFISLPSANKCEVKNIKSHQNVVGIQYLKKKFLTTILNCLIRQMVGSNGLTEY